LELLHELVPSATLIAFLGKPTSDLSPRLKFAKAQTPQRRPSLVYAWCW
jgi:hypothetical protein